MSTSTTRASAWCSLTTSSGTSAARSATANFQSWMRSDRAVLRGVKSSPLIMCTQVRVKLLHFTEAVIQTCHATAVLDCVLSFAKAAIDRNWVEPLLVNEPVLYIEGGRHPLCELCVGSLTLVKCSLLLQFALTLFVLSCMSLWGVYPESRIPRETEAKRSSCCMPCCRAVGACVGILMCADTFVPNDSVMDSARNHPLIQLLTGPNYVMEMYHVHVSPPSLSACVCVCVCLCVCVCVYHRRHTLRHAHARAPHRILSCVC
jgi:hypothetical protein